MPKHLFNIFVKLHVRCADGIRLVVLCSMLRYDLLFAGGLVHYFRNSLR